MRGRDGRQEDRTTNTTPSTSGQGALSLQPSEPRSVLFYAVENKILTSQSIGKKKFPLPSQGPPRLSPEITLIKDVVCMLLGDVPGHNYI